MLTIFQSGNHIFDNRAHKEKKAINKCSSSIYLEDLEAGNFKKYSSNQALEISYFEELLF